MAAQPDTKVERDLLRLVYASLAAPGLTDDDLESIEASSAGRNRAAGLTGLLLHQGGSFFALLEGPRRRLLARMERIITDPRHRGVDILVETTIPARRFEFLELRPTAWRSGVAHLGRRRLPSHPRKPPEIANRRVLARRHFTQPVLTRARDLV